MDGNFPELVDSYEIRNVEMIATLYMPPEQIRAVRRYLERAFKQRTFFDEQERDRRSLLFQERKRFLVLKC